MNTTRAVLSITVVLVGFSSINVYAAGLLNTPHSTQELHAEETAHTPNKVMNFEWTPPMVAQDFTMIPTKTKDAPLPDLLLMPHHKPSTPKPEKTAKSKSKDSKDWEDKVMAAVPQAKQLKKMWNFIDGDTDLHFTGLRIDRGNKGLKYSTHFVPMIGEMETVEVEFMAGQDLELSLESSHIPFAGDLDGFKFKTSVSNNKSKILARYTIPFD